MTKKRFVSITSLNVPEMRPLGTFLSILSIGYCENNDCYKNFDFSLGYLFPTSIYGCTKFHYHQVAGEKVMNDQNFENFCL